MSSEKKFFTKYSAIVRMMQAPQGLTVRLDMRRHKKDGDDSSKSQESSSSTVTPGRKALSEQRLKAIAATRAKSMSENANVVPQSSNISSNSSGLAATPSELITRDSKLKSTAPVNSGEIKSPDKTSDLTSPTLAALKPDKNSSKDPLAPSDQRMVHSSEKSKVENSTIKKDGTVKSENALNFSASNDITDVNRTLERVMATNVRPQKKIDKLQEPTLNAEASALKPRVEPEISSSSTADSLTTTNGYTNTATVTLETSKIGRDTKESHSDSKSEISVSLHSSGDVKSEVSTSKHSKLESNYDSSRPKSHGLDTSPSKKSLVDNKADVSGSRSHREHVPEVSQDSRHSAIGGAPSTPMKQPKERIDFIPDNSPSRHGINQSNSGSQVGSKEQVASTVVTSRGSQSLTHRAHSTDHRNEDSEFQELIWELEDMKQVHAEETRKLEQELDEAYTKVSDLTEALDKKVQELAATRGDLMALKCQVMHVDKQTSSIILSANSKAEESVAAATTFSNKLVEAEAKIAMLQKEVTRLREIECETESVEVMLRTDVSRFERERNHFEEQLAYSQEQLYAAWSTIEWLEATVADLDETRKARDDALAEISYLCTKLEETAYFELEQRFHIMEVSYIRISSEQQAAIGARDAYRLRLEEVCNELDEVNSKLAVTTVRLERFENQQKDLHDRTVMDLQRKHNDLQRLMVEMKLELKLLHGKLRVSEGQANYWRDTIEYLVGDFVGEMLKDGEVKLAKLLTDQTGRVEHMEESLKEKDEKIQNLSKEVDDLRLRLEKAQNRVSDLEKQMKILVTNRRVVDPTSIDSGFNMGSNTDLQQQLTEKETALHAAEESIKKLESQLEYWRKSSWAVGGSASGDMLFDMQKQIIEINDRANIRVEAVRAELEVRIAARYEEELKTLRGQLNESTDKCAALHNRLLQAVKEKESTASSLQAKLKQQTSDAAVLTAQLEFTMAKLMDAEKRGASPAAAAADNGGSITSALDIMKYKAQIDDLTAQLETVNQTALDARNELIEVLYKDHVDANRVVELEATNRKLELKVEELESVTGDYSLQVAELTAALDSANDKVAVQEAEIADLKESVQHGALMLTEQDEIVVKLNQQISNLNHSMSEHQLEWEARESEMAERNDALATRLVVSQNELSTTIAARNSMQQQMLKEIKFLEDKVLELDVAQARVKDLEHECKNLRTTVSVSNADIGELRRKLSERESDMAVLQGTMRTLELQVEYWRKSTSYLVADPTAKVPAPSSRGLKAVMPSARRPVKDVDDDSNYGSEAGDHLDHTMVDPSKEFPKYVKR